MIQETYGMTVTTDMSVETAEKAIREALADEGFGILTEIDVAATFAKKLDMVHRPYKILGACNPVLAQRALQADERMGLLLPCNVVVAEGEDGSTVVSILDPSIMEQVAEGSDVEEMAVEARARLERALAAIS